MPQLATMAIGRQEQQRVQLQPGDIPCGDACVSIPGFGAGAAMERARSGTSAEHRPCQRCEASRFDALSGGGILAAQWRAGPNPSGTAIWK